jgi:carotene biosynthesis associated membrane protein
MSTAAAAPAAGARAARAAALPWVPAAGVVACQIAYPLLGGTLRDGVTVLTVCLGFTAALTHALWRHGARAAGTVFAIAVGLSGAVEVMGVHTGMPFGGYAYGGSLGPALAGVPLVVPLAWAMTAYPALVVARRLAGPPLGVALVGGWALAAWDVFLDPQMVAAGHWRWHDPTPALPGTGGIPLTNYAGWLVTSVVLVAVLDRALPRTGRQRADQRGDLLPGLLYLWTYGSQVLANAAFFGRPALAFVGGVLMGAVAVPYARTLLRSRACRADAMIPWPG